MKKLLIIAFRPEFVAAEVLIGAVKKVLTVCVIVLNVSVITGCKSPFAASAPPPAFDTKRDIKDLEAAFKQSTSISSFYSPPSNQTAEMRNKFITGRLVLINLNYCQWLKTVTTQRQLLDSASDILVMSLNLAGTAVGAAETKTILAAVSAGIAGGKTTIDKNYFYEKTVPALAATMNAQRKQMLIGIIKGLGGDLKQYPFEQAVTDLNDYYMAGTFQGALDSIQTDAGTKDKTATATINFLRSWSYSDDDSGNKIFNFLFEDGDSAKPIAANVAAFKNWRANLKVAGLTDTQIKQLKETPIEQFLHDPTYKDLREQAIKEIPIN